MFIIQKNTKMETAFVIIFVSMYIVCILGIVSAIKQINKLK
jgi:hypothetical protein